MSPEKKPRQRVTPLPRKAVEIPQEDPKEVKKRDGVPDEHVGQRPMTKHYSPLHSGDHWSRRASKDDPANPDRKKD